MMNILGGIKVTVGAARVAVATKTAVVTVRTTTGQIDVEVAG